VPQQPIGELKSACGRGELAAATVARTHARERTFQGLGATRHGLKPAPSALRHRALTWGEKIQICVPILAVLRDGNGAAVSTISGTLNFAISVSLPNFSETSACTEFVPGFWLCASGRRPPSPAASSCSSSLVKPLPPTAASAFCVCESFVLSPSELRGVSRLSACTATSGVSGAPPWPSLAPSGWMMACVCMFSGCQEYMIFI